MPVAEVPIVQSMDAREFKIFRELIQKHTGIWLRDGKQTMLAARLSKRLRHLDMRDFAAYAAFIDRQLDGGIELGELINCVTTNKTSFFREMHHFDFIAETLVPQLLEGAKFGRKKQVRIWSAACSTGEEPYSIAISLVEALQHAPGPSASLYQPGGWEIQVVASDIDTAVLATAAQGIYSEASLADVPQAAQHRHFLRGKGDMRGRIQVKPGLAQLVKFRRLNLKDSLWTVQGPFDAIFFRNALIYFNQETQELFLRKMLTFLKPRGYLILGHSEHVPWLADAAQAIGNTIHQLHPRKPGSFTGKDRRRFARQ